MSSPRAMAKVRAYDSLQARSTDARNLRASCSPYGIDTSGMKRGTSGSWPARTIAGTSSIRGRRRTRRSVRIFNSADCRTACGRTVKQTAPGPCTSPLAWWLSQPRLSRLPSPGVRATACTAVVARHARPSLDGRWWRVPQPRSSGRVASGRATYTPRNGRRQGGEPVGSGGGIWPRGLRRRRSR